MKKQIILLLLFTLFSMQIFAQSKSFENVTKFRVRNSGTIIENGALAGYFIFYLDDKLDRKNDAYLLQILDNNLNAVKTINVVQPKNTFLVEAGYNGKAFVMMYYSKGDVDVVTYDKAGTKLGSRKFEDINKYQKMILDQQMESEEANPSISPLGTQGFVKQAFVKNDKLGYAIDAYGNDLKPLWSYASNRNSDLVEAADVIYSSEKYVVANIARKNNISTKSYDGFIVVIDAVSGKKLFEKPLKEDSELSVMNCFVNEATDVFNIIGEYYTPGEEILKSKSLGLFALSLDITGAKKMYKKISWAGDIKKFKNLDPDSKDKIQSYFHKIVRMKDGKIIAIGEQFKRQVSAMGVASQLLGGGQGSASAAELKVGDMVVMTLDDQFNLLDYKTFDKKSSIVYLPAGAAYMSSAMTSAYVKSLGGFDYSFTQEDKDRDRFYAVYTDYNRKDDDNKKSDAMIGVIKYEDGKLTGNRVPINTEGNLVWFYAAKPGYIQVNEYFKKKKMINMRLEKINY